MKTILSGLLGTGLTGTAFAHTGDGNLIDSLLHQLFASHHLPLSLLILVAIIAIGASWYRRKSSQ